jgi:hypothetical protein
MAEALAARGMRVTFAWPDGRRADPVEHAGFNDFDSLALDAAGSLMDWLVRHEIATVILGYWQLAEWLPAGMRLRLVLDHVAPRLLEGQFENRDELAAEAAGLIRVLARCDEVWVGNAAQRDLMLPLVLLAGHDCRYEIPVRIVPIAGRVGDRIDSRTADMPAGDRNDPLRLFHGGRDWPWRNSKAWLTALREHEGPWRLIDAGERAGLTGHGQYLALLGGSDLALELGDDNTERRYSQSFRMIDALCAGVPVICNDFLPLAGLVQRHECGWTVTRPNDLPALLESIAADRAELARRGENAFRVARMRFDADDVYGGLAGPLTALHERDNTNTHRPLIGTRAAGSSGTRSGVGSAFAQYLSKWADRRLRRPWQNRLSRSMAGRPMPDAESACWVVLGRSDVFPTHHGAAVKIERTAWGLSFHLDEVILLTDRRDGYWLYRRGEREFRRFPAWPRLAGGGQPDSRDGARRTVFRGLAVPAVGGSRHAVQADVADETPSGRGRAGRISGLCPPGGLGRPTFWQPQPDGRAQRRVQTHRRAGARARRRNPAAAQAAGSESCQCLRQGRHRIRPRPG